VAARGGDWNFREMIVNLELWKSEKILESL